MARAKKKKSDNAEIRRRVEEVLRIRLDGAQFHDIVQFGSEKGWGVTDRQIRKYIARADGLLVERLEKKRKRVIARRLSQREALFARAVNAADYRTALAILTDMDKLQGHYTSDRDIRDILKLAAVQEERIRHLENRLAHRQSTAEPTPPSGPPTGPTDGSAAERVRPAEPLPGRPGRADD